MKKILAALMGIMLFASAAKATDLYVYNWLDRDIKVAIVGHEVNYNSLNTITIKSKGGHKFFNWGAIKGPIRFAYADDVGKPKYYFFETTREKDASGRFFDTLPVGWAAIRGVIISKADIGNYKDVDGQMKRPPVIEQSYPRRYLTFGQNPKFKVIMKETTTKNVQTGEASDW